MKGITGKLCLSHINHLYFARLLIKKCWCFGLYSGVSYNTDGIEKEIRKKKKKDLIQEKKATLALPGMFAFSFLVKKESFQIKFESMDY